MEIPITLLHRSARLPHRSTLGAAGFDLCACLEVETVTIRPGTRIKVPTGLMFEIPQGFEGQVRPRSGLADRSGVTVLNAPGTIDSDYRGEVSVILINHGWSDYTLNHGDRIAQIVFAPCLTPILVPVAALATETPRGAGGFGSTGS